MKPTLFVVTGALATGLLAGCDRKPEEATRANTTTYQTGSAAGGSSAAPQANTPTTPANAGTPSPADKAHGSNPVQGQVDPKQPQQHKDFQQRGDGAGPKHPGGG